MQLDDKISFVISGYVMNSRPNMGHDPNGTMNVSIPLTQVTHIPGQESANHWRESVTSDEIVIMKECDNLLNNLTPELLKEYADFLTASGGNTSNTGGACVGPGIPMVPVKDTSVESPQEVKPFQALQYASQDPNAIEVPQCNPCEPVPQGHAAQNIAQNTNRQASVPLPPTSGETIESLVADPLLVSNAVPPDDVLRSPYSASSPRELPLDGSFSLSVCGSDVGDGETSVSALSETLSVASHGSGGTVTIMRREPSLPQSPQGLSEPLAKLLAPLTSPPLPKHSGDYEVRGMMKDLM